MSPIQDLITTPSFGMGTTSGSFALKGLNASKDAPIATMLRKAGCIVIGKANLSVCFLLRFLVTTLTDIGMGQREGLRRHERMVSGGRSDPVAIRQRRC